MSNARSSRLSQLACARAVGVEDLDVVLHGHVNPARRFVVQAGHGHARGVSVSVSSRTCWPSGEKTWNGAVAGHVDPSSGPTATLRGSGIFKLNAARFPVADQGRIGLSKASRS